MYLGFRGTEEASDTAGGATDSPDSVVSWQSIFWALLGAAFNVALQNVGNIPVVDDDDQSTTLRIALRSSPIVCVVDTVNSLGAIIWLTVRGVSPVDAARHVWLGRFPTPGHNTVTNMAPTIDSHAFARDKLWGFNILAFLLGTFPQMVKLFGCRNIPAGQSLAAVYLAAFVVPEILRFIATLKTTSPLPPLSERLRRSGEAGGARRFWEAISLQFAILIQVFLWIWIISQSWLYDYFIGRIEIDRRDLLTFVFLTNIVMAIMMPVIMGWHDGAEWDIFGNPSYKDPHAVRIESKIFMLFVLGNGPIPIAWLSVGVESITTFVTYTSLMAVCGMAFPIFCIGLAFYRLVLRKASASNGSSNVDPSRLFMGSGRRFCTALFPSLNMVTFFVYYRFMFTSDGTVKPNWAEQLG